MKRVSVLGLVVAAFVAAATWGTVRAQQPAPAPAAGRGPAPGVGMIQKVRDNLFMIPGAGGNTVAYLAANGVVLVDTKLANNGQAILDQVKSVTDKPITHIINTHTHGDHNGSNQFFPASVEIVVQENTDANMKKMPVFQEAANKHGLADRTYKDKMTLLSGNDAIDLYYFGRAHTDGDTFVVFRNARVLHPGDAFASRAPGFIDAGNGGSGVEWGETIGKAAKTIRNVDTVLPSHITGANVLLKWQDFVDWGEFNRLYVAHARESLKAGKTPEQAAMDFKPGDKFSAYTLTGGRGGAAGNFGTIYGELKTAK
jgi:glyoxylase-like metal-dependent hydrolase (beta-lactamase superfamily II)